MNDKINVLDIVARTPTSLVGVGFVRLVDHMGDDLAIVRA